MSYSNVHFILFKPQLAENIGACARALKNFNFSKLKIVSPKISFPNEKVFATSVGAKDIINASKVYSNFEDAIKNEKNTVHETADVIYHLLVTLESAGINFDDIIKELEKREGTSGFEEKRNRQT